MIMRRRSSCCCCRGQGDDEGNKGEPYPSKNAKVLIVAIVLFTLITAVQFVAAIVSNSNALLVDCASMLVDALTYAGNLHTECADSEASLSERDLARRALITSGASLAVLYGITLWGLSGAVADLMARQLEDDLEPHIVLVFGVLGIVVDVAALYAFRIWGGDAFASHHVGPVGADFASSSDDDDDDDDDDKEAALSSETKALPARTDDDDDAETTPPSETTAGCGLSRRDSTLINMCSALSHVLADSIRSLTSIALGLSVIIDKGVNGARADAIATIIISATIVLGNLTLLRQWLKTARVYFFHDATSTTTTTTTTTTNVIAKDKDHRRDDDDLVVVLKGARDDDDDVAVRGEERGGESKFAALDGVERSGQSIV